MRMIKLKTSGAFKTKHGTDENMKQFSDVEIVVPFCDEQYFITFAQRLFPIIHRKVDSIKEHNFAGLITIAIDDYKEVEDENPCAGKDVKEMTWEELQYLACTLKVREIPLYLSGDLRSAREKAYETYMKVIKKKKVFKNEFDRNKREQVLREKYKAPAFEDDEIEELIAKDMEDSFDMTVYENNPQRSYSFAKLPALIAVPAEPKKVGRPVGSN